MSESQHIQVKFSSSGGSAFLPARPSLAEPERDLADEAQRSIPLVSQPALAPAERTTACPFSPRSCPFGGACHTCPVGLQAKLKVGAPDDEYEREADRVADTVLRMPDPAVQRSCPLCADDERLQANPVAGQTPAVSPEVQAQIEGLRGGGRPLDPATRAFFEPRFGYDFSAVRVHTDSDAAESARAINALAYTLGQNVVFGAAQYAPETVGGRRLVAHELTHVVQQNSLQPCGAEEVVIPQTFPTRNVLETSNNLKGRSHAEAVQQPIIQRFEVQDCPTQAHTDWVSRAHGYANDMLSYAYSMSFWTSDPRVQAAAWRNFKIIPQRPDYQSLWNTVISALYGMTQADSEAVYECETVQSWWHGYCRQGAPLRKVDPVPSTAATAWMNIHLCPFWWVLLRESPYYAAAILTHEWAHKWAPGVSRVGDTYCWEPEFQDLPTADRVQQPDAYASYIWDLNFPGSRYCERLY